MQSPGGPSQSLKGNSMTASSKREYAEAEDQAGPRLMTRAEPPEPEPELELPAAEAGTTLLFSFSSASASLSVPFSPPPVALVDLLLLPAPREAATAATAVLSAVAAPSSAARYRGDSAERWTASCHDAASSSV